MSQQLTSAMNAVTSKIKTEVAAKMDSALNETFFQKNRKKYLTGEAQAHYQEAINTGKKRFEDFTNSVHDSKHPKHHANVVMLRDGFKGDMANAQSYFANKTCDELNAPNPEDLKEDPAYESRMINQFRPTGNASKTDFAFFDILQANLKKSRDQRGYGKDKCYDNDVILDWQSLYGKTF